MEATLPGPYRRVGGGVCCPVIGLQGCEGALALGGWAASANECAVSATETGIDEFLQQEEDAQGCAVLIPNPTICACLCMPDAGRPDTSAPDAGASEGGADAQAEGG